MQNFNPYYINNLTFQVKRNFTEPCPNCGVPACGKEDILWYKKDEQRIAIVFDGSLLDLEIGDYLTENMTKENYAQLPYFIQSWNEAKGWSENWNYDGFVIDIDDFLAAINLLSSNSKWLTSECLLTMKLAIESENYGLELKIVRG